MIAVRLLRGIAGVAGLGALTLGLLFWIVNLNFISLHMLFGLILSVPDPYDIIGQYHFLCRPTEGSGSYNTPGVEETWRGTWTSERSSP